MSKENPIPYSKCKSNYFVEWKTKGVMLIFLLTFLMAGCAPGPRYTWKAEPYRQSVENEYFTASIAPTAFDMIFGGYEAFDLIIKNKTSVDIELDWNKTLYIERNQTKGGFMFDGVVYKDRNNPKPPDIIFSGAELRKNIWPNALVSFSGRWDHNPMPAGQNGVYLTIKIKDKEVQEKIVLDISRVAAQ